MIQELKNKILNMIARAVLTQITVEEDGTITTKMDILDGETREDVEAFQQYGFASVPLEGAEGITVFLGGDRDNGVTIATEDGRYRLKKMEGGEVALYTDEGDVLHFKRNRTIYIETENLEAVASKTAKLDTGTLEANATISATIAAPLVTIDAPQVNMSGNLTVAGVITGASVAALGIVATGPAGVADVTGPMATIRADLEDLNSAYGPHVHGGVTVGPGATTGPVAP